jgi:uncharacterized protein (TIRG00374 family)
MTDKIGGVNLDLFTSFKQVIGSYSANMIIPGKMGEVIRIPWMRKYHTKTPVLILVLLEKIFDLLSIFLILLVSLIIYLFLHPAAPSILLVICCLLGLGFIILVCFYRYRQSLFSWIELKFKSYLECKDERFFYYRLKTASSLVGKNIKWYLFVSLILWIVQGLEFYAIFMMFDVFPSLNDLFTGSFLALLVGALPVSIAGLGPRDAVIISFFRSYASFEVLAGIGIMTLIRIIFISLIGLPFFFMQSKE